MKKIYIQFITRKAGDKLFFKTLFDNSILLSNPIIPIPETKNLTRWIIVLCSLFTFNHLYGQTSVTFTTSGSINPPAGVTSISVQCWGAGGGGSTITSNGARGGGGGGGAYASNTVSVSNGTSYSFVVGTGGTANTAGGSSSFNTTSVVAAGGSGALNNSSTAGTGGPTGASIGSSKYAGGNGANGDVTANFSGGGGGGAGSTGAGGNAVGSTAGTGTSTDGGNGGTGVTGSNNGNSGSNYGGGGSGAVTNNGTNRTGGSGANGLVRITYTPPTYSLTGVSVSQPTCVGSSSTIRLNSSATNLPIGTYTVTYNLSGSNIATGNTATMTVTTAGTGTFTTTTLPNTGTTTITITNLSSGVGIVSSQNISSNNTANITISSIPAQPGVITGNISVCTGSSQSYSVTNTSGVNYTWSFPTGWTQISGGTTNAVSVTVGSGSGNISVTPSNSCGTGTARTLTVTVNTPPTIITSPSTTGQNICQNGAASALSVTATGTGLSYQWYRNTTNSNSGGTLISGATSANYTPSTSTTGTLYYYCIVSGTCSPAATSNVSGDITVSPVPLSGTLTPSPAAGTVCSGTSVSATATTGSGGAGTITDILQYRYDGGAWNSYTSGLILTTSGHTSVDIQTYRTASGSGCTNSSPNIVSWTVNFPPTITEQPSATNQSLCQNGTATSLSVNATGTGLTYQWYSNTSNSNSGGTLISGATSANYTPLTSYIGTLYYYCIVSGSCSPTATSTVSGAIIVNAIPSSGSLTPTPAAGPVCPGTLVSAVATAGAGGAGTITDFLEYRFDGGTWSTYISGTDLNTTGHYSVEIRTYRTANGSGCTTSSISLVSWTVYLLPTLIIQPSTTGQNLCQNGTATALSVTATGAGLSYQWYSNTSNSNSGGILIPGAVSSSYTPSTASIGTLYYYCIVSGTCTPPVTSNVSGAVSTVAIPVSGTLTPTPAVGFVCSSASVSATLSPGSGGAGTITDVIQYRYDGGSWNSYTSGLSLNTTGHSSIDIQTYRTASGSGCTQSTPVMVSWSINPEPSSGSLTPTPAVGIICAGTTVSATATIGTGGAGTITDIIEYQYDNGSWTNYTPGTDLSTTGHSSISIRTYRTATGAGCTQSSPTVITWNINPVPQSGTLTPIPSTNTVCEGSTVSATATSGSGGAGTITDILQYRFDGGIWITYTSGTNLNTTGHTSIEIQTYRTASGSGCTQSTATVTRWDVTPKPISPTANNNSTTYTGNLNTATISATPGSGETIDWYAQATGGTALASGSTTFVPQNINVGTYTYYAEARNTTIGCISTARTAVTLTINPAVVTITALAQSKTYGSTAPTTGFANTHFTVSGLFNSDAISTASLSYSGTPAGNLATASTGSYTITPSAAIFSTGNASNYTINYTTNLLTVNTALLTITASAQTKTYGTVLSTTGVYNSTFTVTGLQNTDAINSVTLSFSGSPAGNLSTASVGSYSITPSLPLFSSGNASNYNITYTSGSLTVNAAILNISANTQSKSYGSVLSTAGVLNSTFTVSGLQNTDVINSVTLNFSGSPAGNLATASVGSYSITPSAPVFTTGTPGNYTISFNSNTLTVNAAILTITATSQSKQYGSSLSTAGIINSTFTVSGLKNSDAISSLTLNFSGAPAGNLATASVGSYTITPSGVMFSSGTAGNYSISYANGMLTVNAAALSVTASNQSKAYGTTAPTAGTPGVNFTVTGLMNSDAVSGTSLSYSGSPAGNLATASVGSYIITPSAVTFSTGSASNYSITYTSGTLTISKATLTITASAQTKTYGATLSTIGTPGSTFTVAGLQNTDAISSITLSFGGSPAGNLTTASVGSYSITPSAAIFSNGNAANYTIGYSTGTLTVNKAALFITANNQSKCQGDAFIFNGTEYSYSGLLNSDVITGITLSSLATSSSATAGTYTISPSNALGNGLSNYTITYVNGTFTVYSVPSITLQPISQTVCEFSGTTTYSVTASGTGLGYQWQEDAGSGFANVSNNDVYGNATTSTLTITNPGYMMNGYKYRCVVYNLTTCQSYSASATLTVTPEILNNVITTDQSVCMNSAPAQLTGSVPTGGTGTYTYRWESSTTSSTTGFVQATGVYNSQNYTPGVLNITTWYRRVVTSGSCSEISDPIKVTYYTCMASYQQTTPGTYSWTVPSCVSRIIVETWGGGGRGSNYSSDNAEIAGGGGGGGAYSRDTLTVTYGTSFRFSVGAGSSTTANGGDSRFYNNDSSIVYVLAKGGVTATNDQPTGALGGNATQGIGAIRYSGGNGADGKLTGQDSELAGGGGGSSAGTAANGTNGKGGNGGNAPTGGGSGGNGGTKNKNSTNGATPGGGGGGCFIKYINNGNKNDTIRRIGATGGNGQVIISWIINLPPTISLGSMPSVCGGTTNANISYSVSNNTPDKYKISWNAAAKAQGFIDVPYSSIAIPGQIPLIIPSATAAGTWSGTLKVMQNATQCESQDYTISVTITASLSAVNISPSGSQTLCEGDAGALLTAIETGGGNIISRQWGKRLNPGGAISNITGATGNTLSFSGASLGVGTWYLVCTSTPSCGSIRTSNEVKVTVNANGTWLGITSSDWHTASNWCGGVPSVSTNVIIQSGTTYQPIVGSGTEAVCNNLTINAGATLTVSADKSLTVSGTTTNNAGTTGLVLQSTSSNTATLLHNTGNVPATINRYISGAVEDWHFLSSPVGSQSFSGTWTPSGTYGNGSGYDLYMWYEPTSCWYYQLDTTATKWRAVHPQTYFVPGQGYLYSVQSISSPTKSFSGTLNNGTFTIPLTANGSSNSGSTTYRGFNLIGNPYPSSIDWKASSGWTRGVLVDSLGGSNIWIWNPAANNYGVYNSAFPTDAGTNGITRFISPMQSFFVKAASNGNLTMTNAVRVHDHSTSWKSATTENNTNQALSLIVSSDIGNGSDEVLLWFGIQKNIDGANKLFSEVATAPSLFLKNINKDFSIRYLTNTRENKAIPVAFKAGQTGSFTLYGAFNSSVFDTLLLEDRFANNVQDLVQSPVYHFTAKESDASDRFVLHFTAYKINRLSAAKVYFQNDQLHVDLTQVNDKTDILIYNVIGNLILQKSVPGNYLYSISLPQNYQSHILLVGLRNRDGEIYHKVLYK